MKTFYRSSKNKKIAGICGGIAEYFNFDPTLVRVLFVVLALNFGTSILLYLILWLVVPLDTELKNQQNQAKKDDPNEIVIEPIAEENYTSNRPDKSEKNTNSFPHIKVAIFLILLGLTLFLTNFFSLDFHLVFPLILIIIGVLILLRV